MPGLLQYLADKGRSLTTVWDANPNPEDVDLWLPSSITTSSRPLVCVDDLPGTESRLRSAQCVSALQQLRQVLRLKTRMVYYKNKSIRGQRDGTRSRAVIDCVHKRAIRLVHKYRDAHGAKKKLDGSGDWQKTLRELRNEDVRGYESGKKKKGKGRVGIWEDGHEPAIPDPTPLLESEEESEIEMGDGTSLTEAQIRKARKKGTGETRKELSWIWTVVSPSTEGAEEPDDILRSEWARSRARSRRASEEVILLREEMRRVLAFLEWKAKWWDEREDLRTVRDLELSEGISSYAESQAGLQRSLADSFRLLWKTPLREVKTGLAGDAEGMVESTLAEDQHAENDGDLEEDIDDEIEGDTDDDTDIESVNDENDGSNNAFG